jgi:steroid delta-isomerase-like uncharacterized protein
MRVGNILRERSSTVTAIDITAAPRRFAEEIVNGHRIDLVDEVFAPDYTNHGLPPTLPPGREGEKAFVGMFLAAFPDARIAIEDVFSFGDKVASRVRFSGTHTGDFMGLPPTGKSFSVAGMNIFRIRDGQIVENWSHFDMAGLMQQLS